MSCHACAHVLGTNGLQDTLFVYDCVKLTIPDTNVLQEALFVFDCVKG